MTDVACATWSILEVLVLLDEVEEMSRAVDDTDVESVDVELTALSLVELSTDEVSVAEMSELYEVELESDVVATAASELEELILPDEVV